MKNCTGIDTRTYAEIFGIENGDFYSIDLEYLNFKVRTRNILVAQKCRTLQQLFDCTPQQMFVCKNSGKGTLDDIASGITHYLKNGIDEKEVDLSSPGMKVRQFCDIFGVNSEDYKTVEIESLGFWVKVRNCLQVEKCETLQELLDLTPERILNSPCSGILTLKSVKDALDRFFTQQKELLIDNVPWEMIAVKVSELLPEYQQKLINPFFVAFCKMLTADDRELLLKIGDKTVFWQLKEEMFETLFTVNEKRRLVAFLDWIPQDLKHVQKITYRELMRGLTRFEHDTVMLRSDINPWTFKAIGKKRDVSRQAVQLNEEKAIKKMSKNYGTLTHDPVLFCAATKGKDFVTRNQVEEIFGRNIAQILFWTITTTDRKCQTTTKKVSIVQVEWCQYHSEGNLYSAGMVNVNLDKAIQIVEMLPDTLLTEELYHRVADQAQQYGIDYNLLINVVNRKYKGEGNFSTKKNSVSKMFMRNYILKNYFRYGYKVGNSEESRYEDAKKFKKYLAQIFGYKYEGDDRALDNLILKTGVLVGRGKYVHRDYFNVEQNDLDILYAYIEDGPVIIGFKKMFEDLGDKLNSKDFKNRYVLHGALTKYGCKYYFDRDYIYKDRPLTNVDDEVESIRENGL